MIKRFATLLKLINFTSDDMIVCEFCQLLFYFMNRVTKSEKCYVERREIFNIVLI